jgi:hypothetical protein
MIQSSKVLRALYFIFVISLVVRNGVHYMMLPNYTYVSSVVVARRGGDSPAASSSSPTGKPLNQLPYENLSNQLNNSYTEKGEHHEASNTQQNCQLRDLSNHTVAKVGYVHRTLLKTHLKESSCLFFECNRNDTYCDNELPTNYDGPKPPCCNHILRDMSRIFDEMMCNLGLEYSAAFGTLLGLRRSDHLIPWTIDNDYIIPSKDVANAMVSLWDTKKTGMAHIFQGMNRMCLTPYFAGGALQRKWERPAPGPDKKDWDTLYASGLPYMDLYVGHMDPSGLFASIDHCRHLYKDIFPTKRELVYFPANSDQVLRTFYGRDWRIPQIDKNPHGGKVCPYGPTYQ